MQMLDVHAIDSGDTDTMLLLVVPHPLVKVLVGLLRVAVVTAAITAGQFVLLYELQCDIEIVRSDILAQDKAVAVTEQDHSPDNIGFVFDKHTSCKKIKPTHSLICSQVAGGLVRPERLGGGPHTDTQAVHRKALVPNKVIVTKKFDDLIKISNSVILVQQ